MDGWWQIRHETSKSKHPAAIAGKVQAGGGSIMVWGMFSLIFLCLFIIVESTMDQYKYASVLSDHVYPFMRIAHCIYQQDIAECLTAYVRGSGWLSRKLP
ncbi:transposable element Tcb1 transposase [Trichonephila clavipes]|nr:transposable element Tcb1 transposase [Trichonephila clavipes]